MNSRQVAYQIDGQVARRLRGQDAFARARENHLRRVLEKQIPNMGGQLWTVGEALREQAKEKHNGR